jgi:pSer/pThr/pTyr-binding forkhead associated (FHA) protein
VICPQCESEWPDESNFCSHCGSKLESPTDSTATITLGSAEELGLTDAEAAAVDALNVGQALLVVQRGPAAGNRFLLDRDEVNAGRHPDSEIFLDDVTVSRRHAQFSRLDGRYMVRDTGSLNGTYVNRDRIESVELNDGDEVQIGKFRLVFLSGAGASR